MTNQVLVDNVDDERGGRLAVVLKDVFRDNTDPYVEKMIPKLEFLQGGIMELEAGALKELEAWILQINS